MAGKKESPRQKMIGMMYLVLTALLALQVSSALLYKFEALNSNIEDKITKATKENDKKKTDLVDEVKTRGNKPKEVVWAKQAQEISANTHEVLGFIDGIKKELIQRTGGYNDEGSFKGASEETEVEVYMIGASEENGKAHELKKKLDNYVAFMSKANGRSFSSLAPDAKEDPKLKNNPDQRNKNFAQLNFGQTPLVAALAVLSEIESRVIDMETHSLTALYDSIGITDYKFDKLKPFVRPKSDFVVAGTKYEADVCMVATSTTLQPQMEVGAQQLKVDGDGVGELSFTAQGGNYSDKGLLKRTWTGKIKMKKPDGTDTVYTVTQEYNVVRPVIQVQSASIQNLYRNCGNKLSIQVPALGADYQPTFEIEGGTLSSDGRPGNVMIIPTGRNVTVKVRNKGVLIGEERFGVKLVPLPSFDMLDRNRVITPLEGGDQSLATVTIRFKPDPGFKEQLPQESNYIISEGTVMYASNKRGGDRVTFNGNVANVSNLVRGKTTGHLIVDIKKIKRRNYRGEWEEIAYNETRLIPILEK